MNTLFLLMELLIVLHTTQIQVTQRLFSKYGKTVQLSTHSLQLALGVLNRVLVYQWLLATR